MIIDFIMNIVAFLFILFSLAGCLLFIKGIMVARQTSAKEYPKTGKLNLIERVKRYEGPIDEDSPFFNPLARIAIEFFSALFGFPGLGWMISGQVFIGLVLMGIIPCFVWAAIPAYLVKTIILKTNPYAPVIYLPALAFISAACLASNQYLIERRRSGA
jgi:hypothetical protein